MLFHARTNAMFGILLTIDVLMLDFAIESVIAHGVSGIVLFGSEYAILLASLLNSILKYYVMLYDLRRARSRGGDDAPVWENKSMYMFYIELITGEFGLTSLVLRRKYLRITRPAIFYRFPQVEHISRLFHRRYDVLWTPAQHHSGRVHDWSLVLHAFPRFTPLSRCHQGHGNKISRRNRSRVSRHV